MSCLFNSMSRLFPGAPNPQEIRNKICDYLAANPTIIDLSMSDIIQADGSSPDLQSYVQRMRSPSTWGGAIEIAAASQLWNCSFQVKVERTGNWIEFIHPEAQATYNLSWTGGHYEPLF